MELQQTALLNQSEYVDKGDSSKQKKKREKTKRKCNICLRSHFHRFEHCDTLSVSSLCVHPTERESSLFNFFPNIWTWLHNFLQFFMLHSKTDAGGTSMVVLNNETYNPQ